MCQILTQGTICDDSTGEFLCECSVFQYFDLKMNKCLDQLFESEECIQSNACRSDLGLSCGNNVCECDTGFWNGTSCVNYFTYNTGRCQSDSQCKGNLICQTSASSCNCPSSVSNSNCDCVKTIGNENYWDGYDCVPAGSFGQPCSNILTSYMCRTLTEDTVCSSSSGTFLCECSKFKYFNLVNNKCLDQLLESKSCLQPDACRSDLGLSCKNDTCNCDESIQYWDGSSCRNYLTYNTGTCTNDSQCKDSLICKTATSPASCNCPTIIANSNCDCSSRTVGNEFFWNGTQCTPAIPFKGSCLNIASSYMCRTLTEGTVCSGNITASYTCQCPNLKYFNVLNKKCENQIEMNDPCSQIDSCRSDLGLECINGKCNCGPLKPLWDGFECVNTLTYNRGPCSSDNECNGNLICQTNGASCNCPLSVTKSYCDCPIRSVGNEFYWNGFDCVPSNDFGESCTNKNYECKTLTQGTLCTGTPGTYKCSCPQFQYFDLLLNKCTDQLLEGEVCSQLDACRNDLGLGCQEDVCVCVEPGQFWNDDECRDPYSYAEGPCWNNDQCSGNLICVYGEYTRCNCPINVDHGCDCPRYYGEESYWNGFDCVPAKEFGEICSETYECQTQTYFGTECVKDGNSTVYRCKCPELYYWNIDYDMCSNQLNEGSSCSQLDACRSDLNLQCIDEKCKCYYTKQFWNGSTCVDYLTYNNGHCFGDSQCASNLVCRYYGNSCNCPLNVDSNKCDCPTREPGYEMYWDGSVCKRAGDFLKPCMADYMCQTLTEGTICSSLVCKCPPFFFFNITIGECDTNTEVFSSCKKPAECNTNLGLDCIDSICQCNEKLQFWNGERCVDYYTYNKEPCTRDFECKDKLICLNTKTSCNCPTNVTVGKCDCPRSFSNEYYWDGKKCVQAGSLGASCKTGTNYMCQELTEYTQCYKGACSCGPQGYWKSTKCVFCKKGWILIRQSCFRQSSEILNTTEIVPALSSSTIQDICYDESNAKLGRISNSELNFVMEIFDAIDKMYINAKQVGSSNLFTSTDGTISSNNFLAVRPHVL